MARKKKRKIRAQDLEGFKYLELLEPFLERLCGVGTEPDRAGNRDLYFDQYTALILLYFFSPIVTSLRGLQIADMPNTNYSKRSVTPIVHSSAEFATTPIGPL